MYSCNYDKKTGIHYGCISQNSLNLECMDSWYESDHYWDAFMEDLESKYADDPDKDEKIQDEIDSSCQDEHSWYIDTDEYKAEYSNDLNAWIILKSPYYTYCRQCSPCVPNAGDLDAPTKENGIRTYCLPFYMLYKGYPEDKKNMAYQRIWSVGTGKEVFEGSE